MRHASKVFLSVLALYYPQPTLRAADAPSEKRLEAQAALKPYGGLVGSWRGTGQPERGRSRGSWRESANWAWKLSQDSASLELSIDKGKYLRSATLRPGTKSHGFILEATLADGEKRTFSGEENGKKALILAAEGAKEGLSRITLTPLHETRLLLKLEARDPGGDAYFQLGEVGYTREGVAFATGDSAPICIVTEGRGSMPVTYKGKTYYVCCSGCRDLFEENPEAILAEAAEREKSKKK
ncbi:hypothetical protein [Singulisphaera sp. PoT]|uniref:hypothetical protein n=1 Tax=Singulisphaera sp. PoT TaxID=3411797 RepID=UPI003BF4ACEB